MFSESFQNFVLILKQIRYYYLMRADAIVVPPPEISLGMTEMSAPVEIIGHPTEMRKIILTSLVEITIRLTGSRCS